MYDICLQSQVSEIQRQQLHQLMPDLYNGAGPAQRWLQSHQCVRMFAN